MDKLTTKQTASVTSSPVEYDPDTYDEIVRFGAWLVESGWSADDLQSYYADHAAWRSERIAFELCRQLNLTPATIEDLDEKKAEAWLTLKT